MQLLICFTHDIRLVCIAELLLFTHGISSLIVCPNSYDSSRIFFYRFVSSLRQKLESLFPDTATHVNNTQIDYIVNLHYKNINIYFEYIHLIVLYFVILLYLYFSVSK